MNSNLRIDILPNCVYLEEDGTFNKEKAFKLSGKIAGECYSKEGFKDLLLESDEKSLKRSDNTLNMAHFHVYDHTFISFDLQNIPKMLAMVINNEKLFATCEKSARYTSVERKSNPVITPLEEELYNKWLEIFKVKIKSRYGHIHDDKKIQKLAQENARYLVTVFMPTQMIYTTSLRQINNLARWMNDYIKNIDIFNTFEVKLAHFMQDFVNELERLQVLEDRLMINDKNRSLSLFGKNLTKDEEIFTDIYSTLYTGSLAQLAQAHRHRTIHYQMEFLENPTYFVPPIIEDDNLLVEEWLSDLYLVEGVIPQGLMVNIREKGEYENFILKCKERLCSEAQLEIMLQTRSTLLKYKETLESTKHYLASDIVNYSHGARCTFNDYNCLKSCKFNEGITLTRKI